MKGNTMEELIDILVMTGEATFFYKKDEYQFQTDGNGKKIKYSIWKAGIFKPLVEFSFDAKDEKNPEMVKKILNMKCFEDGKSFMEAEKDIEITYHG